MRKIIIHNHYSKPARDAEFGVGTFVDFKGRVGRVEGEGPQEGMTVIQLASGGEMPYENSKSVVAQNSYLRKISQAEAERLVMRSGSRDEAKFSVGSYVFFKGRVGRVERDGPIPGMTEIQLGSPGEMPDTSGKSIVASNDYLRKISRGEAERIVRGGSN